MVDTSLSPYFDDFNEDKQFNRILFRPSRAVQARELTQLQTILQNQLKHFGQNIFLDGSVVIPGNVSIDKNYEYVKVSNTGLPTSPILNVGDTIIGEAGKSNLIAKVLQIVIDPNNVDPDTIYIKYMGGNGSESNGGRFQNNEIIAFSGGSFTTATLNASGTGTKVDLTKGIYFVRGTFAAAISQSLIVNKYSVPTGIKEIGLRVSESIVDSTSDITLLDNANGSSNKNAPGADRLKITLDLINKSDITSNDDYFTIVKLKDTEIVEALTRSTYSLIGNEMARRTFEESGNYTIDPFILSIQTHPTDPVNKLQLVTDPGVGYVNGHRIEKPISEKIDLNKALNTDIVNNERISTFFGNYVRATSLAYLPNISIFDTIDILDSINNVIGTCRVRALEKDASPNIFKIYLFDVQMNVTKGFNLTRKIQVTGGGGFVATIVDDNDNTLTTNIASLKNPESNSLLFKVPNDRIKQITDISIRVQKYTTGNPVAGSLVLDTNLSTITWADTSNWIVIRDDTGALITPTYTSVGAQTITLSNLPVSSITAITYVDKTSTTGVNNIKRIKTPTTTGTLTLTPNGDNSIDLGEADIIDLISVLDSNSIDITNKYRLDNGQRDNFYENGKLFLKSNVTPPTGNVSVVFKYFAHGIGSFFSVDSYNSIPYNEIPEYTLASGKIVRLADVFDFRPKKSNTNINFQSTGAEVNELPKNNETIIGDVTYFLPRIDVLYLDANSKFNTVTGNSELNPVMNNIPGNVMPIYKLYLNAGTLDNNDITVSFIENKRYTMRDIGKLEKRISRVEEWTTLSALENSTQSFNVLDALGNNRFKSGFFVDNFVDHFNADLKNLSYRASIDIKAGELRPAFDINNIRIIFKSTNSENNISSNIAHNGDTLLLQYSEVSEIEQPLASNSINVNPYSVSVGIGDIKLSPETDEWHDTHTNTVHTTIGNNNQQVVSSNLFDNFDFWVWNWHGDSSFANGRFAQHNERSFIRRRIGSG